MLHPLKLTTCILLLLVATAAYATEKQHNHSDGMNHSSMASNEPQPTQGGQAAFAAIIEIVGLLEQNPATNWDTVDIDLLRSHLLDMNLVMLNTTASKEVISDNTIRFTVTANESSMASVKRMVPTHSQFVQQTRGWDIQAELTNNGATVTISSEDTNTIKRLNALGFYGFMSLEAHHQTHHYQMARGKSH